MAKAGNGEMDSTAEEGGEVHLWKRKWLWYWILAVSIIS